MLSLSVNMKKTADFHEIQRFAQEVSADVMVGFLAGKKHVETLHKDEKGKNGKYRGIDGSEPDFEEIENAELAKMLSFGAPHIPPRPFLEDGILSKKDEILKTIGEEMDAVKQGRAANWNKVGVMAVGAVQEFVRGDYYKSNSPNAPRTIKYKGSDTPLIDGADLINSVEFVVEKL